MSEAGIRILGQVRPDGTQDPTRCAETSVGLVGEPGELCALPDDLPNGDPQPGCRLFNIGLTAQPDLDCNGVDDTEEGRCSPVGGVTCSDPELCPSCEADADCASGYCISDGDLCPFIGQENWFLDTNRDGIGDECQCLDQTADGFVTALDIGGTSRCASRALPPVQCDPTLVDGNGDNTTTAIDVAGAALIANGVLETSQLLCVRNSDTTPQ